MMVADVIEMSTIFFLSSSALVAVFIINKVCLVESAFWPFRPADKADTNTEADCSYIDISTFTAY